MTLKTVLYLEGFIRDVYDRHCPQGFTSNTDSSNQVVLTGELRKVFDCWLGVRTVIKSYSFSLLLCSCFYILKVSYWGIGWKHVCFVFFSSRNCLKDFMTCIPMHILKKTDRQTDNNTSSCLPLSLPSMSDVDPNKLVLVVNACVLFTNKICPQGQNFRSDVIYCPVNWVLFAGF